MLIRDPHTAQIGAEILPFEVGYLPEYFQKKAEVELKETPQKIVQCLKQLKDLIKLDKKLMHYDLDEDFLLQHLRARKYNLELAFRCIRTGYNLMKSEPDAYSNFKYEETVQSMNDKVVSILPWRCQDGCAIILIQLDNWKPDIFSVECCKRMIVVFLMQSLRDPMTQVNGFKVIFDVKSTSLKYIRHLTPHNLYLFYHGTQECTPGRFKGFHIVNNSLTFKTVWLIMKQFFSDKLKQRIHFHSSAKTLFDFFPRAVIPVSFGGNLEDYNQSEWLKRAMAPEELAKIGGGLLRKS